MVVKFMAADKADQLSIACGSKNLRQATVGFGQFLPVRAGGDVEGLCQQTRGGVMLATLKRGDVERFDMHEKAFIYGVFGAGGFSVLYSSGISLSLRPNHS